MDTSAISNNSLDIQSILINSCNGTNCKANTGNIPNQTANYAQKGEPMYMEEMDTDGDGTITLDEYKEYCKSKGIGTKEMVKMSQLANTYRTFKAESEAIDYISKLTPNIHPNLRQTTNSESVYARQGENKYNISMDTNHDKVVSYKEYMAYCQQNSKPQGLKSDTKYETTDSGNIKITNTGKNVESYGRMEKPDLQSTFEDVV